MGSEDASVYIYNLAGSSPQAGQGRRGASKLLRSGLLLGGGAAGGAPAPPPLVMKCLKGHRSPIGDVAWAFDESRLASGCGGGTGAGTKVRRSTERPVLCCHPLGSCSSCLACGGLSQGIQGRSAMRGVGGSRVSLAE